MTEQADICQACPLPKKKNKTVYSNAKPTVNRGKKKLYAPAKRDPSCNVVASTSSTTAGTNVPNGSSTTTVIQEPCVGPRGPDGWGFKWESKWETGKAYVKQSEAHPLASTVEYMNSTWVCIQDHTSSIDNQPPVNAQFIWRGEWTLGEVYTIYDADHKYSTVEYFGTKYICIQAHIAEEGLEPDVSPTYWAEAGEGTIGQGIEFWELMAKEGQSSGTTSLPKPQLGMLDQLKKYADDIWDWVENADLVDWLTAGAIAAGVIWAGSEIIDRLTPPENEVNRPVDRPYDGDPTMPDEPGGPDDEDDDTNWGNPGTDPNGPDDEWRGNPAIVPTNSLRAVLEQLCTYAGIAYDASAIPLIRCEFVIASNTQVRSVLEQLAAAYQFDMIDSGGVLKFIPRNATVVDTITLNDMGFSSSDDAPTPYTAKRFQGITLPRSVSMTYISPDLDYNNFTQKSEIISATEGQDVNISVPMVLTHSRAKTVCETTLVNAQLERMNYKFNTTYKYIKLEPGDVVDSPVGLIRINKVNEIEEGILEFEASDAGGSDVLVRSGLGVQLPSASNNTAAYSTMTGFFFLDPNNLSDQDKGVRIYCAVHGFGKDTWPGAAVYMSSDNGNSYKQIGNTNAKSTLGLVEAVTPYTDYHVWDNTTEIIVKLASGTLISRDEIAVINGANMASVGQEIIGFCNATLIGDKTYKLSKLMRGRQGTEVYASTHTANELFVLWDNSPMRLEFTDAEKGATRLFKVLSVGQNLADVDPVSVKISSNNCRPWTVHSPTWNFINTDIKVNWQERVRFDNQLRDFAAVNHDEDWGGYAIAVLDDSDVVKSTHTTTSTEFIYTNEMQVADFGQLKPHVKMSILQMSTKYGGGLPITINT